MRYKKGDIVRIVTGAYAGREGEVITPPCNEKSTTYIVLSGNRGYQVDGSELELVGGKTDEH